MSRDQPFVCTAGRHPHTTASRPDKKDFGGNLPFSQSVLEEAVEYVGKFGRRKGARARHAVAGRLIAEFPRLREGPVPQSTLFTGGSVGRQSGRGGVIEEEERW